MFDWLMLGCAGVCVVIREWLGSEVRRGVADTFSVSNEASSQRESVCPERHSLLKNKQSYFKEFEFKKRMRKYDLNLYVTIDILLPAEMSWEEKM
jgi:hypothetical protein